jgi:protein-L-isoaspartate(D-aspartate) O-methyltransferase
MAAHAAHPPLALTPGVIPPANGLATLRRLQGGDQFADARERMVAEQLAGPGRGLANPAVLGAMRRVPRHQFVDARFLTNAYVDMPLPFPDGVVLETPYVIAVTADQLAAQPDDRVLDVEPGTAYEAAVFSLLVREVYVTESASVQAEGARVDLERLGYTNNVFVRQADVDQGWPETAPFDTIVFHGPLAQFPKSLLGQLKSGGRVIIPVSDDGKLRVLRKYGARLVLQNTLPVRPAPIPGNQVEMHVAPVLLRPAP